jgi:uncharacterized protein YbjT (DUF2867 family)
MKVLVTGATGNVGSVVVAELLKRGADARTSAELECFRSPHDAPSLFRPGVRLDRDGSCVSGETTWSYAAQL